MSDDLYDILGVSRNASDSEIRRVSSSTSYNYDYYVNRCVLIIGIP